jgi:hypothetical protein
MYYAHYLQYLLLACQLFLAGVLTLAASGKLLDSAQFVAALRLSRVPDRLVVPVAVATPTAELALALALVVSTRQSLPAAMGGALVLLAVFTGWITWVMRLGLHVACGCFGTSRAHVSWWTAARNAALGVVALLGLGIALRVPSLLPPPSFWLVVTAISIGLCLMLAQSLRQGIKSLVLTMNQLDRLPSEHAS